MKVESLELDNLTVGEAKGNPVVNNYIDLLKNVKVSLEIVVGNSEMNVNEIFSLKENSVVSLNKDLSEPLEVRLEGKVIARGKLAAVEDNFAIQITEVCQDVARHSNN